MDLANFIITLEMDDTRKSRYFERGQINNIYKTMNAYRLQNYYDVVEHATVLK